MNIKIETLNDLINIVSAASNENDERLRDVIATMSRDELELYLLRMTYLASMIKVEE